MLMTSLGSAELTAGASLTVLRSSAVLRHITSLQGPDAIDSGNAKLLMIFIGLVAVALVAIAIVVVVLAVVVVKAEKKVMGYIEEVKAKALPIIDKSHGLIVELTPEIKGITNKVHGITGKVEEITGVVRDKVNEFAPTISAANMTLNEANNTAREANNKAREQVSRVNGMVTSTLDATVHLGKQIHHGITQPTREIAGVVSGLKAAMESLMSKSRGFGAGFTPNPNRTANRPGTTTARSAADVSVATGPESYASRERRDYGL